MARVVSISLLLGLAAVSQGSSAQTSPPPTTTKPPVAWDKVAATDIGAAYDVLRKNHPGFVDPQSKSFATLLKQALTRGLALARQAKAPAGYTAALQRFTVTLQDGHAGIIANLPNDLAPPAQWPGFVVAWRGSQLYVFRALSGEPLQGAQIVGCDGRSINRLIRENVFGFVGRVGERGQWWSRSRNTFVDVGNPFIKRPNICAFRVKGKTVIRRLRWSPTKEPYNSWRELAYNGASLPIGLTEPRPGLLWIAMPTFSPDDQDVARYEMLFTAMSQRRTEFDTARAIILDLRQNQGGSSLWGQRVASGLWGARSVDDAMSAYFTGVVVRWRATEGNIANLVELLPRFERDKDDEALMSTRATIAGMRTAASTGKGYYDEPPTPAPNTVGRSTFKTPVYVIVPGQCASACLDALDVYTRFPNTILIGAPSSADTNYLDVWSKPLPSGYASVLVPSKVWIHRKRLSGQAYFPKIEVSSLDWSIDDFVAIISADLQRHRKWSRRPFVRHAHTLSV